MINFLKQLFGIQSSEKNQNHVHSFNRQQAQEEDVKFIDHGEQTIALDKITGSVGKYHEFDSRFRPKKHISGKRFRDIKRAMRDGDILPPVSLYQIRNDYYVLDGNHRVSAAKELGWTEIQATVVELLSSKNTLENLLYIEKKMFYEMTGLCQQIDLTEVGKYKFLETQIKKHQLYLANQSGRDCDLKKASNDWYNTIYAPMTAILSNGDLIKYFPGRTLSDLYAYITYHHWERSSTRRYGIGIDQLIPHSMTLFRKNMLEKNIPEYPDMKRRITAFIMINIDTSSENRVLDKLFALDGVQEVHSVHGSIDILVKMILKRDFLTSDAETIAEFVNQNIRRIEGISRTQTIIPGISKVKPV
ncbi:MAG: Lrp/AsnC ligand binding domain-containing protein [Pseudomonadota bacterium]